MKNHLYYMGLNPATMKSFLSGPKKKNNEDPEEQKDFNLPRLIDTSQISGDIIKMDASVTHFGILTSLGLVYTWGVGKSGQLARPDDDSKSLELIEFEDKYMVSSDVGCGGDCTIILEKENGRLFGCGFNSHGQLGKMENEEEGTTITLRAKKKVIKLRQPNNIHFRLRELLGLPKYVNMEIVASGIPKLHPPRHVDKELVEWILKTFNGYYDAKAIVQIAVENNDFEAASLIESLDQNFDNALKYTLKATVDKNEAANAISDYLQNKSATSIDQSIRLLKLLIEHWSINNLPGCDLEAVLQEHISTPPWDYLLSCAIKEIISPSQTATSTDDSSSTWISANFTPVFILNAIKESQNERLAYEGKVSLDLIKKNVSSVEDSYSSVVENAEEIKENGHPPLCPINRFSDDDEIDI